MISPRQHLDAGSQDARRVVWDQLFSLTKQIKGASYAWASAPTAPAGTIKRSEY